MSDSIDDMVINSYLKTLLWSETVHETFVAKLTEAHDKEEFTEGMPFDSSGQPQRCCPGSTPGAAL